MDRPKLAYIVGNPASGKSTLRGMLDGHPSLAVSPVQGMLLGAFMDYQMDEEICDSAKDEVFDILGFRKQLANAGYYKLQANQEGSPRTATTISLQHSSDEKHTAMRGFDFYNFERHWLEQVNKLNSYHPVDVLFTIFKCFFEQWDSYEITWNECEYVVGTGGGRQETVDYLLEGYKESKLIVLDRDPRGIIAARAKVGGKNLKGYLNRGRVFDFIQYMDYIHEMKQKYNDRILIIDFRDLILNHKKVVGELVDFLDIKRDNILNESTLAQRRLHAESDQAPFGQINDDWRELLDEREKRIIGLQMGEERLTDCTLDEIKVYLQSISRRRLWNRSISKLRPI